MSVRENIEITHGKNGGEYKIPNSKYKADGYCKENKTIYEFHGTIFHGDPRLCNPNESNCFGRSYKLLYERTMIKEKFLKNEGYNCIIMWEYDWKKINKSMKLLQKIIRLKINSQKS